MDPLEGQARSEIETAIYAGRKIDAIKRYREAVPGTDLVDAKKAVEVLTVTLKEQHPENFGPAASKTGCLGVTVIWACLAGSLAFLVALGLVWI